MKMLTREEIVGSWTGIYNGDLADYLRTFAEIELDVAQQSKHIAEFRSKNESVMAELAQAQIRATLLLAAQVMRVANAFEEQEKIKR